MNRPRPCALTRRLRKRAAPEPEERATFWTSGWMPPAVARCGPSATLAPPLWRASAPAWCVRTTLTAASVSEAPARGPTGCVSQASARIRGAARRAWEVTGRSGLRQRLRDGGAWRHRHVRRGRAKEMIKCSGCPICAPEVEAALLRHPAVARCAIIGAVHPEKGEVPVAVVGIPGRYSQLGKGAAGLGPASSGRLQGAAAGPRGGAGRSAAGRHRESVQTRAPGTLPGQLPAMSRLTP